MNISTRNLIIFFLVCFVIRVLLVVGAYKIRTKPVDWINYLITTISLIISFGFILNDIRGKEYGFFGSRRYWSGTFHGVMWIIFGILFSTVPRWAWVILLLDIVFGVCFVINFYKKK